jgi:enoyl-CoA hydratase
MSSKSLLKLKSFSLHRRLLARASSTHKMLNSNNFDSIKYWKEGRVAHVMLNRPERLNAIDQLMPFELQRAIQIANWDDEVHAILLYGAGNAFCAGYDLITFAEEKDTEDQKVIEGVPPFKNQKMPWDPAIDFRYSLKCI